MSLSWSTAFGQPPRHISQTTSCNSRLLMPTILSDPPKRSSKLICPQDSPDSQSVMGRIVIRAIRPAPEWKIFFPCSTSSSSCNGVTDPVRINWPSPSRWSTVKRTASHNSGAICHSSISLGVSPFSSKSGLICANCRFIALSFGWSI